MTQQRDFSEHTAELIDEEVRKLVSQLEDEAETIIKSSRATLGKLARQLLEKEVLDADEFNAIIHEGHEEVAESPREVTKVATSKAQCVALNLKSSVGQGRMHVCGGAGQGVTARNGRSLSSSYNTAMRHHRRESFIQRRLT